MADQTPHPAADGPEPTPTGRARFRRAEDIFFEVAAIAPGDREEAIARLCAGDAKLESSVRALVGAAGRIGSFLEQPALGRGLEQVATEAGVREPEDELTGASIGPFRITRRIASGGMGTVYLAARSDGQFEQTVAIKVVKRGMDSEEILRRFRAERQTLAALDHPNIARLLDGGITPDGRPFLVMEYVDGQPIDVYCDQRRLKVRERLELFRRVCEAVHHAHSNLVIHRDIKPSNILVTPQGVPKLLDFGIAKVLSGGTTTQHMTAETDRRLTPEYASPEQVEGGAVTTATDVYSLGVVLYELLTGSRPYYFNIRSTEELRRVVCEIVPPLPSAAVTVRATRRRGAAGASRAAEPSASSATPMGQTSPPELAPADPYPINVPATRGVSSTRLRSQLRGDLDNVVLMALRKEPQRRYASAEQLAADIGRYLDGMPVQARKDTVVYRATKFVRRHRIGVGLTVMAIAGLTTATILLWQQRAQLLAQRDQLSAQRDELVAFNSRLEDARRYLQTVLSGAETGNQGPDAKIGTVLRDAAKSLETAPPTDPLTRAAAEQSIGRTLMSLGLLPEARKLLDSAAQRYTEARAGEAAAADIRTDLAELLFFEGKPAEAETQFRDLLTRERAGLGGRHNERETLLLNDLGASLRLQGKLDEAIATQREALAARESVHGAKSLPVAESLNNLASALFQKGQTPESIALFRRALSIRGELLRPDHPLIVRLQANLGLALTRAGQIDEAVTVLTAAAQAWDSAFGPDHAGRIATITSLSIALRKQGKPDEALQWLGRALDWQRAHQSQTAAQIAATEANMGIVLAEAGRDAEAEPLLTRAVPILGSGGAPVASVFKSAIEALAALYERTGRGDDARRLREQLPSTPPK